MRTEGGYKTKQRDIILEVLKNNTDKHLSCEEICEILRNNGKKVGTTTVYRYLEKLYRNGLLTKYTADKESAKFSYAKEDCRGHFHLKCTECGEIFCGDCSFLSGLLEHVNNEHGFTVEPAKTTLYGICKGCSDRAASQKE